MILVNWFHAQPIQGEPSEGKSLDQHDPTEPRQSPHSPSSDYFYAGRELDLFSAAKNWKSYWAGILSPLIGKEVAEIGAGLGATLGYLCDGRQTRWLCLEPDRQMAGYLSRRLSEGALPSCCEIQCGVLSDLPPEQRFDTILYIDVLEHIEDDRRELEEAASRLRPGGRIIVLSPAHSWLFSAFDKAVGHHRRYTIASLADLTPNSMKVEKALYLDSAGLLASAANRFLLRSSMPTEKQIRFWDSVLVPISRPLDRLLGFRLGKSVMVSWVTH